ncbi:hypothetical protein [Acidianus sp. HS-5]|uniref:hypothetical protein n=1 Tax=Acidianus sp. HS-5 TaxID=2886040 RepID=UPI001F42076F|nr:hypothetical protein [Acidianus sp. HS-5]
MEKLKSGINYPMTLLLGIRRSGKSSLVNVLTKEERGIWIYLDLRKFESLSFIHYKDLILELEKVIKFQSLTGLRGSFQE